LENVNDMNLSTKTLGFLGAGNMAEALIRGLLNARTLMPRQIIATDIRPERLDELQRTFGIHTGHLDGADIVVLAVKPQQLAAAVAGHRFTAEPLFISILAGIPTARLERELGGHARVVRAMPNTPALVSAGAAAICAGTFATADDLAVAETVLRAVGLCVRVDEAQMNAVTALSGSGPAYLFYFAECLVQAGIEAGLAPELAAQLAQQTVTGAAQLLATSGECPATLRRKVTSPGGTTEAAIKTLTERQFASILSAAVQAAAKRGAELAAG
jgi:pyrroline-5-carboxylate reductase